MEKIKKLLVVHVDKISDQQTQVKEELTADSNLKLNPEIKDKNFFDDDRVADFLFKKNK